MFGSLIYFRAKQLDKVLLQCQCLGESPNFLDSISGWWKVAIFHQIIHVGVAINNSRYFVSFTGIFQNAIAQTNSSEGLKRFQNIQGDAEYYSAQLALPSKKENSIKNTLSDTYDLKTPTSVNRYSLTCILIIIKLNEVLRLFTHTIHC